MNKKIIMIGASMIIAMFILSSVPVTAEVQTKTSNSNYGTIEMDWIKDKNGNIETTFSFPSLGTITVEPGENICFFVDVDQYYYLEDGESQSDRNWFSIEYEVCIMRQRLLRETKEAGTVLIVQFGYMTPGQHASWFINFNAPNNPGSYRYEIEACIKGYDSDSAYFDLIVEGEGKQKSKSIENDRLFRIFDFNGDFPLLKQIARLFKI